MFGSVPFLAEYFNHNTWSEKFLPYVLMMFGWMIFCPIIRVVKFAGSLVDLELTLTFPVTEPMKPYPLLWSVWVVPYR